MATSLYKEEEADIKFNGDTFQITGTLILGAASGTTAGAAWTTGAPTLTAGQKYLTVTLGSTVYRIPVFANA